MPADPLLDRILCACKLSGLRGGHMPVRIVVEDEAERYRAQALLKGRHNNQAISLVTRAEIEAERQWHSAPRIRRATGAPSDVPAADSRARADDRARDA